MKKSIVILIIISALISFESCTLLHNIFGYSNYGKIKQLFANAAKINVPNPADDVIVPNHPTGFEGQGANRHQVFEEGKKLTAQINEIVAFNPNAGTLFTGALIQGNSLPLGVLSSITCNRNPLTITVNNLISTTPSASFSRRVDNPSNQTITDAITQVLNQNLQTEQEARIAYTQTEFHSFEEGFLRLGANYHWIGGGIDGSFETGNTVTTTRFLVKYIQTYYTVSCEDPYFPASFVSKNTKYENITNYVSLTNPPTYVSSITYGRELWMSIESNYEASEMRATLNVAFAGGGVDLTARQKKTLNESQIHILALGGSGRPVIELITAADKVTALKAYLLAGANYSLRSPGAIISYVVKYCKDNSVAKVSSSSEYTIKTNVATPEKAIKGFDYTFLTGSDDKDDDNTVSISFTLLPANKIVFNNSNVPPSQANHDDDPTWHDWSQIAGGGNLRDLIVETDASAKKIRVTVSKAGGAHWHMGYDFKLLMEDGSLIQMGREEAESYNFQNNTLSWEFNIPWGAISTFNRNNYNIKQKGVNTYYYYIALSPTTETLPIIYSKTFSITYKDNNDLNKQQADLEKKFRQYNANPANYNALWSAGYAGKTIADNNRSSEITVLQNAGKIVNTPNWP